MKIKTSELTGPALDWAVAKCEGVEVEHINDGITRCLLRVSPFTGRYSPSTDWLQGGPIIEREGITVSKYSPAALVESGCEWFSTTWDSTGSMYRVLEGHTPLIAAMRYYVASRLGDEVEIPEDLINKE